MLSIGAQLYEESDRDRATVQLEEFNIATSSAWGIGIGTLQPISGLQLQLDRMLYLSGFSYRVEAGAAAARLREVVLDWTPQGGGPSRSIYVLAGDALANASNLYGNTDYPRILLPRAGTLRAQFVRADTTAAGLVGVTLWGHYIPPGNIARGS